ncbi:phage tail protein [Spirulina subsalsa FACHB-351]|uniref:Phage tail protein n=1 Tax=Spirulina subsalsa FACHB-351 TaxID=234711 RepID=A0ABT3LAD4_9CYAN|nr:phage tail protein [Spirulina subsalsa]MCW6038097.1 phage tail protein [Spirulina subsalsa FACHB-351]
MSDSKFTEILTTSRFYVELKLDGSQDPVDAYFKECKGFKYSQELVEIPEVTPLGWGAAKQGRIVMTKMPGYVKLSNFTLTRSLRTSQTLWNWIKVVQEGNWAKQRRDGSLVIYKTSSKEGARFNFKRAWPVSYKCSDVKADGAELGIEELEIACEEFERVGITE